MFKKSGFLSNYAALALLWMSHFLVDIMIGFWSVYKSLAQVDIVKAALIAGLCPFIGEGMQIVFGSLGDQGYRKVLLIFGLIATTAATVFPYTDHFLIFFFLYLIVCIGSGAFHPSAVAIASSTMPKRKGFSVTLLASGGSFGLAFSHLIFSLWYLHFNGQTLILALPILILSCVLFSQNIPGVMSDGAPKGKRFGFSAMKKLFRCKELTVLYASQVCIQAIFWALVFLLPDVLREKGYVPWISFGGGHCFYILGGAVMMVPGGLLSDKYPPRSVLLFSSALGIVFYYLFLISPHLPHSLVLLLLFLLGACLGLSNPVAVSFGNKMVPSRPGLVSAFLMGLVWCVSESLGPGGAGILTSFFTENAPTRALLAFGVILVFGMMITLLLPEDIKEEIQIDYV